MIGEALLRNLQGLREFIKRIGFPTSQIFCRPWGPSVDRTDCQAFPIMISGILEISRSARASQSRNCVRVSEKGETRPNRGYRSRFNAMMTYMQLVGFRLQMPNSDTSSVLLRALKVHSGAADVQRCSVPQAHFDAYPSCMPTFICSATCRHER
jgi:hypothetical protein